MKLFKSIWGWVAKYFTSAQAEKTLKLACAYVERALPIIETIAAITPTRTDDELIALFKRFALPGIEAWLTVPVAERGDALREVARTVLAREVELGTPQRVLNAAIELAYLSYRGGGEK